MDDTAQAKPITPVATDTTQVKGPQATSPVAQTQQQAQDQLTGVQPIGRHPEHAPIAAQAPVAEVPVVGPDTISDASAVADAVAQPATDVQAVQEAIVKESQPSV